MAIFTFINKKPDNKTIYKTLLKEPVCENIEILTVCFALLASTKNFQDTRDKLNKYFDNPFDEAFKEIRVNWEKDILAKYGINLAFHYYVFNYTTLMKDIIKDINANIYLTIKSSIPTNTTPEIIVTFMESIFGKLPNRGIVINDITDISVINLYTVQAYPNRPFTDTNFRRCFSSELKPTKTYPLENMDELKPKLTKELLSHLILEHSLPCKLPFTFILNKKAEDYEL